MTTLAPILMGCTKYATVQAAFLAALEFHENMRSGYSKEVALMHLLTDLRAIRDGIAARAPVDDSEIVEERIAA